MPRPDIYFSIRIAGFLAGLGEIGYSKVFLNRKLGPRIRLAVLLMDLELEPDPIIPPGTICNRCKSCARACPGHAISLTRTVKCNLAGYELEWGELDEPGCNKAFCGVELCPEGEEGDCLPGFQNYRASSISPFYHRPPHQYAR